MYKLITEAATPNFDGIERIVESLDDQGVKQHYIEGIFIQTEQPNRNGRVYPKPLMQKCVEAYVADRMKNPKRLRTFGELGHPEGIEINLHRSSHLITELNWKGNDVIGKAKLLDTEYGRIAKSVLLAGGQLGVSSRGLGNVKEAAGMNKSALVNEYELIAVDIVADPSAPDGFVDGIMESMEYIKVGGNYTARSLKRSDAAFSDLKESLETLPKHEKDAYVVECVKKFLASI
jgi:hypothetical protein